MTRFVFFETPRAVVQAAAPLYAELAAIQMRVALAKLLLKYNFDPAQPRAPAGNPDGGQWTGAGGSGSVRVAANDRGEGGTATDVRDRSSKPERGAHAALPNGKLIADPYSRTGYLVSPVSDLRPVAGAGRQAGSTYQQMLASPDSDTQQAALSQFIGSIGGALGQGGSFDYQRTGNHLTGFFQRPEFRDVSNFNVGLYMQQTGQFSEESTLSIAGTFARNFSGNYRPDGPFGLDARTAALIRAGYRAGASGAFGKAAPH